MVNEKEEKAFHRDLEQVHADYKAGKPIPKHHDYASVRERVRQDKHDEGVIRKAKSEALEKKKSGKLKVHSIHRGERKDEGYGTGNQFK
jgi:hypothetical protein